MYTVVLIDDEYFFRNSLKNAIPWESHNLQIIGDVNNGKAGMELILDKKPDIAIVDINMPILTGLEMIKQLESHSVDCKYILLTGYDEFKYAQKAIRLNVCEYILKPVDYTLLLESLQAIKEQIGEERAKKNYVKELTEHRFSQIKKNFLMDLLHGCVSFNKEQLESYLTELNIKIPFMQYIVILVEFPDISTTILEEIEQNIASKISLPVPFELLLTTRSQACILIEVDSSDTALRYGRKIESGLKEYNFAFHISLSSVHHDTAEILFAFNEAQLCLKNAMIRGVPLLSGAQINNHFYQLPKETLHTLKMLIQLKNTVELKELIASLYQNFYDRKLTHDNVIFCTYQLISCLLTVLNSQNDINCYAIQQSDHFFETFPKLCSLADIQNWITDFFVMQIDHSKDEINKKDSVSKKVETYVQLHYQDANLSIDSIANNLFLNYSYICYCFKNEKKITINAFINQIRLDKALELFHSGVDNVGYVAEQTGFDNLSYFSKKFKKAFGLSPSEYIKTL